MELKERLQTITQRQNAAIENDRFEEADELEKAQEEVRMQVSEIFKFQPLICFQPKDQSFGRRD